MERAHSGKTLWYIPGAEEASMFEACERGDKGRLGQTIHSPVRISDFILNAPGSCQRVLGFFRVVLTG